MANKRKRKNVATKSQKNGSLAKGNRPRGRRQTRSRRRAVVYSSSPTGIRIDVISPMLLFKSIILLMTLVVAIIAIYNNAYDAKLWTFLGSMLMYAALTSSQAEDHR